jgi:hypothetical protein
VNLNIALTILVGTSFVLFGSIRPRAIWISPPRALLGRGQTLTILDSAVFTYIGVVLLLCAALRVALVGC